MRRERGWRREEREEGVRGEREKKDKGKRGEKRKKKDYKKTLSKKKSSRITKMNHCNFQGYDISGYFKGEITPKVVPNCVKPICNLPVTVVKNQPLIKVPQHTPIKTKVKHTCYIPKNEISISDNIEQIEYQQQEQSQHQHQELKQKTNQVAGNEVNINGGDGDDVIICSTKSRPKSSK